MARGRQHRSDRLRHPHDRMAEYLLPVHLEKVASGLDLLLGHARVVHGSRRVDPELLRMGTVSMQVEAENAPSVVLAEAKVILADAEPFPGEKLLEAFCPFQAGLVRMRLEFAQQLSNQRLARTVGFQVRQQLVPYVERKLCDEHPFLVDGRIGGLSERDQIDHGRSSNSPPAERRPRKCILPRLETFLPWIDIQKYWSG